MRVVGDNIGDLRNRWNDDVFETKPDWLSIKIGIHDLNQTFSGQNDFSQEKFEKL